MNLRHPILLGAGILLFCFATSAIYIAFGLEGIIVLLFLVAPFILAVLLTPKRIMLINEMEVGVIFNRFNNSFSRFSISPEPSSVRHFQQQHKPSWLPIGNHTFIFNDPYHVRLKWFEKVAGTIPKKPQTAKGTVKNIRTADGVPVNISWKISYTVDVTLISKNLEHKMARTLPEHSDKVIMGKVERALKHLIELRSIQSLYDVGAIQGLEQEICQRVNRQLSQPVNLGFQDIKPKDVSLGPIEMPPKVEKALELAHQRKIQTEMVASALERLRRAVGEFSKEDVRRLAELERLRILDDKEVRSLYLSDAFIHSEAVKIRKDLNGSQSEPTN